MLLISLYSFLVFFVRNSYSDRTGDLYERNDERPPIEIYDLSHPMSWKGVSNYYYGVEKQWKMCVNCGIPGLGTVLHMGRSAVGDASAQGMVPALIPSEFLLTRLRVIDASSLCRKQPNMTLTLDVALQWYAMKHDPTEPTLLMFKFGWTGEPDFNVRRICVCSSPGISYALAEYIAKNMTRVVGVATDAPSLESTETRQCDKLTVSNVLGQHGIYTIENVHFNKKIPDRGCIAITQPLKMLHMSYVPTRLLAICPTLNPDNSVMISLKDNHKVKPQTVDRFQDVKLDEILYW